ncbi:MAG: DUF2239 family protein [Alphaproteobacteria bacterium]|nr:DUF2239 family protein [Alphaproteobacteria bacterium]
MSHVVFRGAERVGEGPALEVALVAQRLAAEASGDPVLIFDAEGRQVDFDLSGAPSDLAARFAPAIPPEAAPRGRGRPKLGVVPREVTLLPRHWDWLASQPGGASVALRKLVEAARREAEGPDRIRRSREAAYRFANVMAGDRPGYEAATRALFSGDAAAFAARIAAWPADIAAQARIFAAEAFSGDDARP